MGRDRLTVALALLVLFGCKKGGDEGRYVPAESNARDALTAALTRWKDGEPKPGEFTAGKTKVQVLDKTWDSGQKLQSFDILGDEPVVGTGPRIFNVRLKTAKGEQTGKYYVFGIDPLWVCDEAGYKQMTGG